MLRRVSPSLALVGLLALLGSCRSERSMLEEARQFGSEQAERDFRRGEAKPRLGCGTIAPGPCSSVMEEKLGLAFMSGYNARLTELRGENGAR